MKRDLTERIQGSNTGSRLIKAVSAPVDGFLNRLFQTTPLRPIKLFFNGSWLGHPLHPLLTDIPIGAWIFTVLLDVLGLTCRFPQVGLAAGILAGIGVAAALVTITAGLMDWMDVDPPEKAVGAVHASLNTVATVIFLVSFLMRWHDHWRISVGSFVVASAGLLVVSAGAYLGGSMVYHMGVMINRNAYRSGPADFQPALPESALLERKPMRVEVAGQPILLVKSGAKIYALGAVCSHYGAPLNEGSLQEETVRCPWHFSRFALDDGSVREGPACSAVPSYEVKLVNGQIHVRIRT
ncbi:MAG: Rieske 2Fe-2S domain-containing protein [Actinomycetota bacterium]